MTVEIPQLLFRPITAIANSAMNQSEFLAITCDLLEARAKSHLQGAVGFGFAHSLISLVEIFMEFANRSYRNRVINFDGHLKTALSCYPLRESRKELVSKEKFVGPPVTSERPYSHCVFHMVGLG